MLAVSPPRGSRYGDDETDGDCADAFSTLDDFSDGAFLDDINFDDLSAGFDVDGGAVPDLDLDPGDIFADFSFLGGEEDDDANVTAQEAAPPPGVESSAGAQDRVLLTLEYRKDPGDTHEASRPAAEEHSIASEAGLTSSRGSGGGGKPPAAAAAAAKNSQGKKKGKVDWTPELHRRFVQAVEHLGVEKAVPSRILELMGIECLTRHNIASHLQKYRSHRKHALAREAEAGSCWVQRRPPTYAPGAAARSHANGAAHRWLAPPTIGFPPPPPPVPLPPSRLPAPAVQNLRPLRVWGHPTGDLQQAPLVRGWPRHRLLAGPRGPPPAAPPPWAPPPPPPSAPDASYWRHHYHHRSWGVGEGWIPHAMTQGTPCFAQAPMPTAMLLAPPVPVPVTVQVAAAGIIPPVRRPALRPAMTQLCRPSSQLQFDAHPATNESVYAAIEDVMSKPWLPMPLGLKPPSVDGVLRELQKQGVAEMPPTCTTATTT